MTSHVMVEGSRKVVSRTFKRRNEFKKFHYNLTARTAAIGIAAFMKTAEREKAGVMHCVM